MAQKYGAVAHHFWDRPGGGQLVCASTVKAFEAIGYEPVLISVPAFKSMSHYTEWFGIDLSGYTVTTLLNIRLRAFGIYLRLLVWIPIRKAIERYKPSIVFTDECAYKPIEKYIRENTSLIEYIHFPIELAINPRFKGTGLYYGEDPYVIERYGRFPMNLYWWGYTKLLPLFIRENPFRVASLVLTNSRWTAEIAQQVYGDMPRVLNPPLPPNVEMSESPRRFDERGNTVVMVGRFSEEKRYHWVIEEVVPRLRRELGGVKLIIIGGTGTKTSRAYFNRLFEMARGRGLKVSREVGVDADVYLIPDAPRTLINSVMDQAKVFLHATINEHWGVAVAEAMSRGLPVVVHKSGGTWSDLVSLGASGLGYSSAEEAVELIARLVTDEGIWRYYSEQSSERARELRFNKFIERFMDLVKPIAG